MELDFIWAPSTCLKKEDKDTHWAPRGMLFSSECQTFKSFDLEISIYSEEKCLISHICSRILMSVQEGQWNETKKI